MFPDLEGPMEEIMDPVEDTITVNRTSFGMALVVMLAVGLMLGAFAGAAYESAQGEPTFSRPSK